MSHKLIKCLCIVCILIHFVAFFNKNETIGLTNITVILYRYL
jgi:hypothetical protein